MCSVFLHTVVSPSVHDVRKSLPLHPHPRVLTGIVVIVSLFRRPPPSLNWLRKSYLSPITLQSFSCSIPKDQSLICPRFRLSVFTRVVQVSDYSDDWCQISLTTLYYSNLRSVSSNPTYTFLPPSFVKNQSLHCTTQNLFYLINTLLFTSYP